MEEHEVAMKRQLWAERREQIERALRHSPTEPYTINELTELIEDNYAHPFFAENSTLVTRFQRFTLCEILAAGGKMDELLKLEKYAVVPWAMAHDCDFMLIQGRKGWDRVMKPRGYKPMKMLMKEL